MSETPHSVKRKGRPPQSESMKSWDLNTAFQKTLQDVLKLTDGDRVISELFIELPLRDEYPDYYKKIKTPISIERIEKKVNRNQYLTWEDFVKDWNLLSKNAQQYNEPDSQVYEDAVSIQKFIKQRTNYVSKIPAIVGRAINEEEKPTTEKKGQKKQRSNKAVEKVLLRIPNQQTSEEATYKRKKSRRVHSFTTKSNLEDSPGSTLSSNTEIPAELRVKKKRPVGPESIRQPENRGELYSFLENFDLDESGLEFLKKQDPDELNEFDVDGTSVNWSLLHCASFYGRMEAVQCLIGNGADLEQRDDTFGSTALIWAAFSGKFETCKYLIIECKADREAKNSLGMSALELCPHSDDTKWKFLFTMSVAEDPSQLTSHLRSILRLNGRLLRNLIVKLSEYIPKGANEPLAAPLMELPSALEEPGYYAAITNPLSLSLVLVRTRAYRSLCLLDEHIDLIISNALKYYPSDHLNHKTALKLKNVYMEMREELLSSKDGKGILRLNEKPEGSSIPTLFFDGMLYAIGDYTLIKDRELQRELDVFLLTEIFQEDGAWVASGLGFKHRNHIPDAAKYHFQPNEVFKVGNKFKVPFTALSTKCCVISLKIFSRYSVENFPPELVFLCEFRHVPESKDAFQTIKDWSKTVCSFPFFTFNIKERDDVLCFVRPPFSDFDPLVYTVKKPGKKLVMMDSQPIESSPVRAPIPKPVTPKPTVAPKITVPETSAPEPPTSEMPCLEWEAVQSESEVAALLDTIEIEATNLNNLPPPLGGRFRFKVDEDFFSMTFDSNISCAIITPNRANLDPEFCIQFKLISNNQVFAPIPDQIPKFMFPLQPGLNVARIQATLTLPNTPLYDEFYTPPPQSVTLIFHRLA